jgi:hypothetical protein
LLKDYLSLGYFAGLFQLTDYLTFLQLADTTDGDNFFGIETLRDFYTVNPGQITGSNSAAMYLHGFLIHHPDHRVA